MLNKLRLDQTRVYERALATFYMAEMVGGYLEGREHPLRLGCEQGGIPTWDDIVIEHHDSTREHIQVKRQETPFDERPCTRGVIRGNSPRAGEPQDLSPLDEAIAAIASTFQAGNGVVNGAARRFTLGILHASVGIKNGLEIRHLQQLCTTCANPTVDVAGLTQLAAADQTVMGLFQWLTTWCGFVDWDHIHSAMGALGIRTWGYEADLNTRAEERLATHFITPPNVRAEILHFIDDHTTYAGAIKPRLLVDHLRQYLKPNMPTWTQYRRDTAAAPWTISGTHGDSGADIEPASSVVPALWAGDGLQRALRVSAPWPGANLNIPKALMRLALHLPAPGQALFRGVDTWRLGTSNSVAGTIGVDKNDLLGLPWINENERLTSSENRSLASGAEQGQEAERLDASMDDKTWEMVCEKVAQEIESISDSALLAAVEALWQTWQSQLSTAADDRRQLLKKMLHATAEGEAILPDLRVGPRTVDLLAQAMKLHLVVAAALGNGAVRWDSLGPGRTVRTIALRNWGGPAGRTQAPKELDDEGVALLGMETADVVIMSGYIGPPGQIEEDSLAADASLHDNFGMPRVPKLLVTNSKSMRKMVSEGSLDAIQDYLEDEIRTREEARARNINQAVGANHGN